MNKFLVIDLLRRTKVVSSYCFYKRHYSSDLVSNDYLLNTQKSNLSRFLLAIKSNNYYGQYLNGVSIFDIVNNPYAIHSHLPITDKEIIKAQFSRISNSSNKFNSEYNYTGGSTGTPFKYIIDKKSISSTRGFNYYLWNRFLGYELGDDIVVVTGTSLGANAGIVPSIYNYLQNKQFISGDVITFDNAVKFVKVINNSKHGIYIYGYPSSLIAYTSIIKRGEVNLEKIKGIITTSEMLSDKEKGTLEQFFNTCVLNVYGANDGGIMAGANDNVHFFYNGTDCYVELVNIDGVNELLLTNLNSASFPFVRYRVGDCAEKLISNADSPFVICNLLGRSRDLLFTEEMNRIHGSIINKTVKQFIEIEQYQIHQKEDLSCDVFLKAPTAEYVNSIKEEFSRLLRLVLGMNVAIRIHYKSELNRSSNGKIKVIISDVHSSVSPW